MSEKNMVLNVTYKAKPGHREAFVAAVVEQGILAKIRAEEGCLQYEYFAALEDADKLFLVERWANETVLRAHMQAPHMADLQKVKEEHVLDSKFECFNP